MWDRDVLTDLVSFPLACLLLIILKPLLELMHAESILICYMYMYDRRENTNDTNFHSWAWK